MTGIEIVTVGKILVELIFIPLGVWAWNKWSKKVDNEELRHLIDAGVRAAEEKAAKGEINKAEKAGYVLDLIAKHSPKHAKNTDLAKVLIDAAVQGAGLGKTAK